MELEELHFGAGDQGIEQIFQFAAETVSGHTQETAEPGSEKAAQTDLQIDLTVWVDLEMFTDPAVDLFRIADFYFAELRVSGQHQSNGIQRAGGEFAEGSLSARGIEP